MLARKHRLVLFFFILFPLLIHAQTEEEIKSQADKLFNSEQYVAATPLYLRLLSLQPRDHFYNFRYGTCLLFNSNKKQSAIKYLNYAVSEPTISPEAYYFLGKAFHFDYQFNQAEKYYSIYLQKRQKNSVMYPAERAIEMCQNGKRLLTTVSDVVVLEKKEIASDKFFRLYDLQDIGGNIIVTAEFQTKLDKKNGHVPLIHFPKKPSVIFYSSYGENAANGKEIYSRRKSPDGSWGNAELVQGQVNTIYDEDFPYMHPDGQYLYFSSKGHNSMGGYDVFRSKYNAQTNSFGKPENLDFAISSPDDDLFYVVDSLNQNAYFASARQSEAGKLFVYKVKVDRVPLQLVAVKGAFFSEVDASPKQLNLEILSQESGSIIGKYTTDSESNYLITLPKGGNYEFVLKLAGNAQEFRSLVSIPNQTEFKPLKQKIVHASENGKETIKIINLFNEEVTDMEAVLAEVVKMRSDLNVNVSEFDLNKVEAAKKSASDLSNLGFGNFSISEVQDLLKKTEDLVRINQNLAQTFNRKADFFLVENFDEYEQLEEQIQQKLDGLNTIESNSAKKSILQEIQVSVKELYALKADALATIPLQDSVQKVYAKSAFVLDSKAVTAIRAEFETALNAGKEEEAIAELVKNKDLLQKLRSDNSMNLVDNLIKRTEKLEEDIVLADSKNDRYNEDQIALQKEIKYLETNLSVAKQKEITAIEQQIRSKKETLKLIEGEQKFAAATLAKLNQEKSNLSQQIRLLETLISQVYIGEKSPAEVQQARLELVKKNPSAWNRTISDEAAKLDAQEKQLLEKSEQVETKEKEILAEELESTNPEATRLAENLLPRYTIEKSAIESDNALSAEQKLAGLQNQDQALISAMETKLKEIEKQLVKNPENAALVKEKEAISDLKLFTESSIEEREQLIESKMAAKILPESINKQKVVYSTKLEPSYADKLNAIASEISTAKQKQLAELEVEQAFLKKIEAEEKRVKQELRKDPLNLTSRTKLQALSELKKEKSAKTAQINAALKVEEERLAFDTLTQEDKAKMEVSLSPDYTQKTKEIETSAQATTLEKAIQLRKIEQEKIEKIQLEQEVIGLQLEEDPTNREFLKEEKILMVLQEESLAKLAVFDQEIQSAQVPISLTEEEKAAKYAEFKSDYSSNVRAIEGNDSIGEREKLDLIQIEDQMLLGKLYNRQDQLEEQMENNPDLIALQKEQKVLDVLSAELERTIEVRQEKLGLMEEISQKLAAEKENAIKSIDDLYLSDRKIIQEMAISELEKLQKLAQEDRELLAKVVSKLDGIALKSELDATEIEEKQILEAIREDLQNSLNTVSEISTKQQVDVNVVTQVSVITKMQSTFNTEKNNIQSNTNLSEIEKKSLLLQLENDFLDQIRTEKMAVQQKKLGDPTNVQFQKERNDLIALEQATEISIAAKKTEINVTPDPAKTVSKEKILLDVFPEFETRLAAIENATTPEKSKLDAIFALETKMLEKLQNQEEAIRKERFEDSARSEELEMLQVLVEEKKARIQTLKEQREQLESIQQTEMESEITTLPEVVPSGDPLITELEKRELSLQQELKNANLSKRESQKVQNEIAEIQQTKVKQEIAIWKDKLSAEESQVERLVNALYELSAGDSAAIVALEIELLQQKSLNQHILKNQAASETTKDMREKKYLLEQAYIQQRQAISLLESVLMEASVEKFYKENGLELVYSEEELTKKNHKYSVTIGNLTNEILRLEKEIQGKKSSERDELQEVLSEKIAERTLMNQQLAILEDEKTPIPALIPTLNPAAIEQKITIEEEQNMALSAEYREYELNFQRIIEIEKEHTKLEIELKKQNDILKDLVQENSLDTASEKTISREQISKVKTMEIELKRLESELLQLQKSNQKIAPQDEEETMKMQNLITRGIKPISKLVIASALVSIPTAGLTFVDNNSTNANSNSKSSTILPVALKNPSGLVYRVQVGAFSKPIPSNLFKEFTPVSGEKLNEKGFTRYLAGYFNSSAKVVLARDQIKALGYADAFAVAYCDGNRITLAEARLLEASGACIPKGENELNLEILENIATEILLDDTLKNQVLNDYSYNAAPGAARAEPIEKNLGLFYTVQIGVFNRPVSESTIFNVDQLLTIRLPNGQIRYSSGMFNSIDSAITKKQVVIDKGAKDAFVTAYYNGNRITLEEAKKLSMENGISVFQNPVEEIISEPIVRQEIQSKVIIPEKVEQTISILTQEEKSILPQRIQIVTKKTFEEFPREVLNRYNSHGSFYFDETDKRVKSSIAATEDELPAVYYFKNAVDTIYLNAENNANLNSISITLVGSSLPGDLIDWLYRFNFRKEFKQSEESIELKIVGIPDEKLSEVEEQIAIFALDYKILKSED